MNQKPFVTEIDMGFMKDNKYAVWFPFVVHVSKTGRRYHINPRMRFSTKESAQRHLNYVMESYKEAA